MAANETDKAERNTPRKADSSPGDAPCVVYRPHPETGPASEIRTLANIYAFVLERYEQKQIAAESATDASTTSVERLDESGEETPTGEGSF